MVGKHSTQYATSSTLLLKFSFGMGASKWMVSNLFCGRVGWAQTAWSPFEHRSWTLGDSMRTRSSFIVENSFHYPRFFLIPDEFANCPFYLSEELSRNFDGDCIESIDCFWQDSHFDYINPANPWAWEIFPPSEIFFNFFLQRLEALVIQIFLLSTSST